MGLVKPKPSYPTQNDPTRPSFIMNLQEESSNRACDDKIYVAVGKSVSKSLSLLQWSIRNFKAKQICLLHVHQPSLFIPTLLGKLPANQANPLVVAAYRNEEKEQTRKLLQSYLGVCSAAKVKASTITIDDVQVQKGIVELVDKHRIKKLVMGAVPDNCMKVKNNSSKANYAAKNAPPCCEIWFIHKGKHVWTREALEDPTPSPPLSRGNGDTAKISRSLSMQYGRSTSQLHPACLRSYSTVGITCARVSNWVLDEAVQVEPALSPVLSSFESRRLSLSLELSSSSTGASFNTYLTSERKVSSGFDSKLELENVQRQLTEANTEAEASRKEAFSEMLKCQKMVHEASEVIGKVKLLESGLVHELKLRKEAEDALRSTIQSQERLMEEREEVTGELQKAMRSVALLDARLQESNRRREEATVNMKVIQASIATLQQEKQKIQRQKLEAVRWLDRWKSHGQSGAANCNGFIGFVEELPGLAEFTLTDLETATCNFSESFKLGQGGYGCVYKGEMLGRTVAIKKLHPYNMQGQSEFQQEVQVLGKLQHPHLVTLLGASPEAWSLVYEYLPNGSLKDRLFKKNNLSPLEWNIRVRMIAEISSALCFLHSSKPEKIVHGDLKPENILLDSELHCKICEFGICRLVTEDTLCCPSFRHRTEPKSAFPYTDPEFHRIGVLTPKSDIYSFGVIILQLLTGRPPIGLVHEVRRAVSSLKLSSILDSSAGEWPAFVSRRLVDLGLRCCELNARDRPDLTPSLVRELEQLHVSEERPVPSYFLCPILQEIMHDPQVAADGFTYEGEALRGWLANGRETSPMTNLKLDHVHLTPNHALRLAIQDWLCKQ